jgi:F-box/leucine-rich repeat protein 2/20
VRLQVVTRFHNLRRIDLMGCYLATPEAIQHFCSAKAVFKRMESINMEAMPELRDRAVKTLAKCTPNLKELSISKCQRISVASLKAVSEGCPQLTRLNLNYDNLAVPTAAPGVIWPPSGLTKLRAIDLRGCPNLTPDLFENLLQTCQNLEMLVTPCHITDVDLNCIANHCPNLVSLDMSYSYYPTDNGVESVANGCPSEPQATGRKHPPLRQSRITLS